MSLNGDDIVITDIEYRDGEYTLYIDETRSVLPGDDKAIKYLGMFRQIIKYACTKMPKM